MNEASRTLCVALAVLCPPGLAWAGEPGGLGWQVTPYWRPVAGISSVASSSGVYTGVRLGATAGLSYWKDPLAGRTRALAAYTAGSSGFSGLDLRLGSFMGPQQKYWGAEAGADLFWDHYSAGSLELIPGSAGVDFPLNLHLGPSELYGLAGVSSALLFDPDRRVDWSSTDAFGFGHEFGWQLGVGAKLGRIRGHVAYTRRTVVGGTVSGWAVSASL